MAAETYGFTIEEILDAVDEYLSERGLSEEGNTISIVLTDEDEGDTILWATVSDDEDEDVDDDEDDDDDDDDADFDEDGDNWP
jgi:hypothetical protein